MEVTQTCCSVLERATLPHSHIPGLQALPCSAFPANNLHASSEGAHLNPTPQSIYQPFFPLLEGKKYPAKKLCWNAASIIIWLFWVLLKTENYANKLRCTKHIHCSCPTRGSFLLWKMRRWTQVIYRIVDTRIFAKNATCPLKFEAIDVQWLPMTVAVAPPIYSPETWNLLSLQVHAFRDGQPALAMVKPRIVQRSRKQVLFVVQGVAPAYSMLLGNWRNRYLIPPLI